MKLSDLKGELDTAKEGTNAVARIIAWVVVDCASEPSSELKAEYTKARSEEDKALNRYLKLKDRKDTLRRSL